MSDATTMLFDDDARYRLREALLAYLQSHKIGVPTLANRIATATDRDIPLKTLQRFLGDERHTNDLSLRPYQIFIETQPEWDATATIGPALARFYSTANLPSDDSNRALSRAYDIYARPLGDEHSPPAANAPEVPYATASYTEAPAAGYFRVQETIINPAVVHPFEPDDQLTHNYEGVALPSAGTTIVFERNSLTRLPRTCYLTHTPGITGMNQTAFMAIAIEVPFQPDPDQQQPAPRSLTLRLLPRDESGIAFTTTNRPD